MEATPRLSVNPATWETGTQVYKLYVFLLGIVTILLIAVLLIVTYTHRYSYIVI